MNRKAMSLVVVIILALATVVVALLDLDLSLLRALLALVLVFFMSGYALVTALFPHTDLGTARTLLFSLGTSISLTILGGFALNLTPAGLQTDTWALLLGGFTIVMAVIALLRQPAASPAVGDYGVSPRQGILFAAAGVLVVAAILISRSGAEQQTTAFTQLWILPDAQNTQSVDIGVRSMETLPVQYKLELLVNNQVAQQWTLPAMRSGEKWESTIPLAPEWASAQSIDAVLYRLDSPDVVYRHTWLQHNGRTTK